MTGMKELTAGRDEVLDRLELFIVVLLFVQS